MNIKEFVGIDSQYRKADGTKMEHHEVFGAVVNAIGLDTCKLYLPEHTQVLAKAMKQDEHLNNIPLAKWDRLGRTMRSELNRIGINSYSLSDLVCTLKQAARMTVEQYNQQMEVLK